MKPLKIKIESLLIILIPMLAIVLSSGLYFIGKELNVRSEALQSRAETIARLLAPASEYGVISGNIEFLTTLLDDTLREADIVSLSVTSLDGHAIVTRINPSAEIYEPIFYRHPIYLSELPLLESEVDTKQREQIGWVEIHLSRSAYQLEKQMLIKRMTLVALLITLAAVVLAIRLARRISAPIMAINHAVGRIGKGDYTIQLAVHGSREIVALAKGINTMATSIDSLTHRQREQIEDATRSLTQTLEQLEQRNTELAVANKAALRASEIKGKFLANMSHELRTPLNGITGFIDVLKETRLNAEQQEILNTIKISSNLLMQIINDILDFSKIEANMLTIESVEYDINECIEDTLVLLATSAYKKGLDLSYTLDEQIARRLLGDPLRIRQVLSNLINNAIKFTDHGSITVNCLLSADEQFLVIEVIDTGIGLSYEFQKNIFSEFTQEDPSITRHYGGTGLGLAVCKRLVELMGGTIDVSSSSGHGTKFWFKLPNTVVSGYQSPLLSQIAGKNCVLICEQRGSLVRVAKDIEQSGGITHKYSLTELHGRSPAAIAAADLILIRCRSGHGDDVVTLIHNALAEGTAHIVLICRDGMADSLRELAVERITLLHEYCREATIASALCRVISSDAHLPEETAAASDRRRLESSQPLKVLVTDDNVINRKLIVSLLTSPCVSVDEADSGELAFDLCLHQHYDLIFMDIHMPGMSGIDTVARIRQQENLNQRAFIIALTADTLPETRSLGLDRGFNDVLIKPINSEMLFKAVNGSMLEIRATEPAAQTIDSEIFSLDAARAKTGNNLKLAGDLLQMLFDEIPGYRQQLLEGHDPGDFTWYRNLAHRLAGSASYCSTARLAQVCKAMEADAIAEDHTAVAAGVAAIIAAMDELVAVRPRLEQLLR